MAPASGVESAAAASKAADEEAAEKAAADARAAADAAAAEAAKAEAKAATDKADADAKVSIQCSHAYYDNVRMCLVRVPVSCVSANSKPSHSKQS